jgi:hypothetical protein
MAAIHDLSHQLLDGAREVKKEDREAFLTSMKVVKVFARIASIACAVFTLMSLLSQSFILGTLFAFSTLVSYEVDTVSSNLIGAVEHIFSRYLSRTSPKKFLDLLGENTLIATFIIGVIKTDTDENLTREFAKAPF